MSDIPIDSPASAANDRIVYRERPPVAALQPWVHSCWSFAVEHYHRDQFEHHVPPDGCLSLLQCVSAPRTTSPLIVVGPRVDPLSVTMRVGDRYAGIRFWPYAARPFLAQRLPKMVDQVIPLRAIWPEPHDAIEQHIAAAAPEDTCSGNARIEAWHRAVESVIARSLTSAEPIDDPVRRATESMTLCHGNLAIGQLAEHLKLSTRQLQRRFQQQTGLTPKQFARIRRFRSAIAQLVAGRDRSWCELAVEFGFADQAHLSREFSQIVGLTAREIQSRISLIQHDGVAP